MQRLPENAVYDSAKIIARVRKFPFLREHIPNLDLIYEIRVQRVDVTLLGQGGFDQFSSVLTGRAWRWPAKGYLLLDENGEYLCDVCKEYVEVPSWYSPWIFRFLPTSL